MARPVESLQGERLETAAIGAEGVAGDRAGALLDLDTGFGLTARRVPELPPAVGALVTRPGVVSVGDERVRR